MSAYRDNAKPPHKHRWGFVWGIKIADPVFYWGCVRSELDRHSDG